MPKNFELPDLTKVNDVHAAITALHKLDEQIEKASDLLSEEKALVAKFLSELKARLENSPKPFPKHLTAMIEDLQKNLRDLNNGFF